MDHIPILRAGRSYRSLNAFRLSHIKTGEPLVSVSQANRGLISKELGNMAFHKQALGRHTVAELLSISTEAARFFTTAELPLDESVQSPTDYLRQVSGQRAFLKPSVNRTWIRFKGYWRRWEMSSMG